MLVGWSHCFSYVAIAGAYIRRPIEDDADLLDMKGISAGPVERFLVDWFAAGAINLIDKSVFLTKPTGEGSIDGVLVLSETEPLRFKSEQLKAVYDAWCKENLDKWEMAHATRAKAKLVQELRKICPLIEDGRTATERGWLLPALPDCRTWIATELTLGRLYAVAVDNLD